MGSRYPSISVIVPVYNGQTWLEDCIGSVKASRFSDWELIAIDDGSTDASLEILNRLRVALGDRMRVLSGANEGEPGAVNKGFLAARGEFVVVLSCDDKFHPDLLRRAHKILVNHPTLDVVYPDWQIIGPTGDARANIRVPNFSLLKLIGDVNCLPGPGALLRKSAVPRNLLRNSNYPLISDYEQWLVLATRQNFARIPEVLAYWRQHSAGQTARISSLDRDKSLANVLSEIKNSRRDVYGIDFLVQLGLVTLSYRAHREKDPARSFGATFEAILNLARSSPIPTLVFLVRRGLRTGLMFETWIVARVKRMATRIGMRGSKFLSRVTSLPLWPNKVTR